MLKKRSFLLAIIGIILLIFALYLCKDLLLKKSGAFLIHEDPIDSADALFVLGGSAFERGDKAVALYKDGLEAPIYCTSGVKSFGLLALGFDYLESEVTRMYIIKSGIPATKVFAIKEATSTFEESEVILATCLKEQYKQIVIISSLLHTKRIYYVFKDKFEAQGIEVLIKGASSKTYKEDEWWKSEQGLIMVNNEYVKLFYYWLKGQL